MGSLYLHLLLKAGNDRTTGMALAPVPALELLGNSDPCRITTPDMPPEETVNK